MDSDYYDLDFSPHRWERKPFIFGQEENLVKATESHHLPPDLARLEVDCGFQLPMSFVWNYRTEQRQGPYDIPHNPYQPHRSDYLRTLNNLNALYPRPVRIESHCELLPLFHIHETYRKLREKCEILLLGCNWPPHLIPLGWDGQGGIYFIESGTGPYPRVGLICADPMEVVEVSASLFAFVQFLRTKCVISIYHVLTSLPPSERSRAVAKLSRDWRSSGTAT